MNFNASLPSHRVRRRSGLGVLTAGAVALMSVSASAAPFTEGNIDNGSNSEAVGQAFGPGTEPTPDPGLATGDPVSLDQVQFFSGGSGTGDTDIRLAILDSAFYDFNGDPDGSFTPTTTSPGVLGVSDNAIDTTALAYGDALSFNFGSGVSLAYGDQVSSVFVTVDDQDQLTVVPVGTAFIAFTEDPPGTFSPNSNYGGSGNFNATSLFADDNGDGFAEAATDAQDLSFQATFSTPAVPEPASLTLGLLGAAALLGGRRRRRA